MYPNYQYIWLIDSWKLLILKKYIDTFVTWKVLMLLIVEKYIYIWNLSCIDTFDTWRVLLPAGKILILQKYQYCLRIKTWKYQSIDIFQELDSLKYLYFSSIKSINTFRVSLIFKSHYFFKYHSINTFHVSKYQYFTSISTFHVLKYWYVKRIATWKILILWLHEKDRYFWYLKYRYKVCPVSFATSLRKRWKKMQKFK